MKKVMLVIGFMLYSTLTAFCPTKAQRLKNEEIVAYQLEQEQKQEYIIPITVYNNNPFNIRNNHLNKWQGKINSNEPFEKFETLDHGIRAGIKLLMNYQSNYGLMTIEDIVYRFAPPFENDTENYINWMCKNTGFDRNHLINLQDFETLILFCDFMIQIETGKQIQREKLEKVYYKYFT
jgi:hypothetical protein